MSEQKPREQHLYEWYMAFYDILVADMLFRQGDILGKLPIDDVLLYIYCRLDLLFCLHSFHGFVSVKFSDERINKFMCSGVYDFVKTMPLQTIPANDYIIKYIIYRMQKDLPVENIITINKCKKTQEFMTKLRENYSFTADVYECLICGDFGPFSYRTSIDHMKKIHGLKFRDEPYYCYVNVYRDPLKEIPKKYVQEMRCVICNTNFAVFGQKKQNIDIELVFDHIVRVHIKTPENNLIINRIMSLLEELKIN